jgi:hypothetical protein
MTNNLETLLSKYKNKGIFVDTQLLIPYLVGLADIKLLGKTKLSSNVDENDFILISEIIEHFDTKITTPNILTETSDLLGEENDFQEILKEYIKSTKEVFLPSFGLSGKEPFTSFGLADTSIIESCRNSYLVFTDDSDLYGYLAGHKIDTIKFSYLRMLFSS